MKVTYYRNWFDGTYSRQPRARFAKAHIVNNLYSDVAGYGIGVTCNAQVFVEANYFENTPIPVLISQVNDPEETLSGDPAGYIKAEDNYLDNSGIIVENLSNYNFDPTDYYSYDVVPGSAVKTLVQENAGAGIINIPGGDKITAHVAAPTDFLLLQNYPNPFNPTTTILFCLPNRDLASLKVYDMLGRQVAILFNDITEAGKTYRAVFNAEKFSSGIYFYSLETAHGSFIRKMVLVK